MPLEQLRPFATPRVMDLVEAAGIDVEPWAVRANGTRVAHPAANPAYCYEWCFVDPGKLVVLSLWFEHLSIDDGVVLQRVNMRKLRAIIDRSGHLNQGTRMANAKRAIRADSAIIAAYQKQLPVRVILCDGEQRDLDDRAKRDPSRVDRRLLDPSTWRVREYDLNSGAAVIARDEPV